MYTGRQRILVRAVGLRKDPKCGSTQSKRVKHHIPNTATLTTHPRWGELDPSVDDAAIGLFKGSKAIPLT